MRHGLVGIRADASMQIGTGHVMRCLVLAEGLRHAGFSVAFLTRKLDGNLAEEIEAQGFEIQPLAAPEAGAPVDDNLDHADWLGVTMARDCKESLAALSVLSPKRPDWLVVDHYAIDRRWHDAMSAHVGRILVIDDLADRELACDLLLDQNFRPGNANPYARLVAGKCRYLLGPRYALLRGEYATPPPERAAAPSACHIVVFFGGVDAINATERVLQGFADDPTEGVTVTAVVGTKNRYADSLLRRFRGERGVQAVPASDRFGDLLRSADLFIGAAGSTTWEVCACGLPSILFSVAANQAPIGPAVASRGAARYLGDAKEMRPAALVAEVRQLLTDAPTLFSMGHEGRALCDGQGVRRVVDAMVGLA